MQDNDNIFQNCKTIESLVKAYRDYSINNEVTRDINKQYAKRYSELDLNEWVNKNYDPENTRRLKGKRKLSKR